MENHLTFEDDKKDTRHNYPDPSTSQFTQAFAITVFGSIVVTINIKLLGGQMPNHRRSYSTVLANLLLSRYRQYGPQIGDAEDADPASKDANPSPMQLEQPHTTEEANVFGDDEGSNDEMNESHSVSSDR
ncbi:unnamed protein product [Cylicocyclus nassatus]|uniref:Uncharacterized protein n=1 Tax=Cylicocyclus nassatus TaxID=53992 RepID=A0AA36M620_CYLNA|nr:unnamed protein product [Cylicocyclus nassatus]